MQKCTTSAHTPLSSLCVSSQAATAILLRFGDTMTVLLWAWCLQVNLNALMMAVLLNRRDTALYLREMHGVEPNQRSLATKVTICSVRTQTCSPSPVILSPAVLARADRRT